MSLIRKYTEINLSHIISSAISLIISIIISRILGPSGKGEYSAAITLSEIVIYLLLLGLGNGIIYVINKRPNEKPRIVFVTLVISLILGIVGTSVIILLNALKSPLTRNINDEVILSASFLPLVSILLSNSRYMLYAVQVYSPINRLTILGPLLNLILLLVFVFFGKLSVVVAIICHLLVNFFVLLVQLYLVENKIGFELKLTFDIMSELLSLSLKSYFISLMTFIILRSDILLLNALKGNYETGIYSVSAALAGKMLLLTSPLFYLLSPRVVRDPKKSLNQQLKISRHLVVFLIGILLIADILYIPAVKILYGAQFVPSFYSFLILNLGIVALGLIDVFSPYFLSHGYPKVAIFAPFLAAILNIFLNLIFIPYYGQFAAAASSTISYCTYYLILIVYLSKKENFSISESIIISKKEIKDFAYRIIGFVKKDQTRL
ncbi:MAG: polysaccharide biosynthesis C-terminal domain-containing protein [Candidatus Micrarchaeota archaeon]|nr:polysaccharide biosynthesis C-terminal domain-containing protein [Candidatus Micrarchaeota archaeon]